MWYLIAEANGLNGTESLVAGQVLVIPNKVTNIHNNDNTFRPYNAGEAIGSLDPTLPAPPPPPAADKGCGVIGMIVMIVVAAVVTYFTAGLASGFFGPTLLGQMATGAVSAAAGSVVSQGVGIAIGAQDKFSWRAVGTAALGGAIAAGVSGTPGSQFAQSGGLAERLGVEIAGAAPWVNPVLQAGVNGVISSGLTMAVQGKWDWKGVAASGLAAAAGGATGSALKDLGDGGQFAGSLAGRMLTGLAANTTSQLVGAGRIEPRSLFANSLGHAIADYANDSAGISAAGKRMGAWMRGPESAASSAWSEGGSEARGGWSRPATEDFGPIDWSQATKVADNAAIMSDVSQGLNGGASPPNSMPAEIARYAEGWTPTATNHDALTVVNRDRWKNSNSLLSLLAGEVRDEFHFGDAPPDRSGAPSRRHIWFPNATKLRLRKRMRPNRRRQCLRHLRLQSTFSSTQHCSALECSWWIGVGLRLR